MNAAHELAEILRPWELVPGNQSVYEVRGFGGNPKDPDFWRKHARAAELLAQVQADVEAMAVSGTDVDHYLKYFPEWWFALFAPEFQWDGGVQQSRQAIADHLVDMLKGLGDLINSQHLRPSVSTNAVEQSRVALDEIVDLLQSPELQLSGPAKRYAFELMARVRKMIDSVATTDEDDLIRSVHELYGFLSELADELERDQATQGIGRKLRDAGRRVLPWTITGVSLASQAIDAAVQLKALGS
jgi:hypothetical protein